MKKLSLMIVALLLSAIPTLAQDGLMFGYCGDGVNGVGAKNPSGEYWIAAAIELAEKDIEQFDGCTIGSVSVGFGSGVNKNIVIFFTEDLAGTPFQTQKGRVRPQQWNNIAISNPVKIEKGKKLFIGWKYNVDSMTSLPVGTDNNTTGFTPGADWISMSMMEAGLANEWKQQGSMVGNVNIRLYLTGANLDGAACLPVSLTMPKVAHPGEDFDFSLSFTNASISEVNQIEVAYKIGTDPEVTTVYDFETPVAANGKGKATFTTSTQLNSREIPVSARITKVNGEENSMADRTFTATFACSDTFYTRRMLCEKLTGTYCQYCPLGIAGFDYMDENAGDTFIGVAVQNYSSYEPMYCPSYDSFFQTCGFTGAPNAITNRNRDFSYNVDKASLEGNWRKIYTPGYDMDIKASFEANSDSKTVKATATLKVATEMSGKDMAISFIVTEDNLGPYYQQNYYDKNPGCPEFFGKGAPVSLMYNDVARYLPSQWNGYANSVPETLVPGEEYPFTVNDLSTGNLQKFLNGNLIAVLLDKKTGKVLNCHRVHFDPTRPEKPVKFEIENEDPEDTPGVGVEKIDNADNIQTVITGEAGCITFAGTGVAQVYTMAGQAAGSINAGESKVFPAGIYVVKAADKAVKVLVK